MVRLKGKVRIEFHHVETGKETQPPVEQENLIFNQTYVNLLGASPVGLFSNGGSPAIIVISSTTTPPSTNNPSITNILASGFIPSGVTSPVWYESVTPNFGEIQNQINAPTSSPRVFQTVGLVNNTSALTATLLSLPCTQNLFEVLTIFYRIEVTNSSGGRLSRRFVRDFGGTIFGRKNCNHFFLSTSFVDPPTQEYIDPITAEFLIGPGGFRGWNSGTIISSHYKYKQSATFQIVQSGLPGATDEYIGLIFNSMLTGVSNTVPTGAGFVGGGNVEATSSAYRISRYNPITINIDPLKPVFQPPFQKIWTHRAGAPLPFFDPNNAAIGSSYPATGGTWTGRWPEIYRFTITSNTGDYRFSRRFHLGFNGNTYSDRTVVCPFRHPSTPAAAGMHGWRTEDNDLLRWSNTQIVQYDQTGVTLLDLTNGNYTSWDVSTTPALNVTALRQCAVDTTNQLIYCACRNTGLWIINVGAGTITQQVATACYGVDVGRNNVAFAIFEGFLRNSTNWTTNLTFTYTGLTDGFWSRALFLKADPDNVNDHLAIIIVSPSTASNRRVVWYQLSTTTSSTGFDSSGVSQWPASLDVSDVGGFWAINGRSLIFGSASTNVINTVPILNTDINHSVWGNVRLYKISFYNNFLICATTLINSSNVAQTSFADFGSVATVLHMQGGIVILGSILRQCFTDNVYPWEEYGWNGSTWELGNSNSKPTHNTNDALIQGLTIRWEPGATSPQFQSGDFFTQGICNGTWKDNGTTIYYENFWYDKAVHFDVALTPTAIPSSPPYELPFPAAANPLFLRIETDSVYELNKFTINGVAVPTIYTNGEAPGPGELTITPTGSGAKATFNSADASKTWAGTYSWIEI
ncbi:hypothetical protein PCC6912_39830 [Chlorogloeopsis fritschii PCC 6912]|uniref:Uncharacterized protein n=1 Tax=Chlorogloeopsis fritschii PCC 6912 TaxID=211165 RepID=A0A3S0ZPT8_CHLFR|nr:hypothetical protein [Chlorogloeopsis fritschii]RUR77024.1 hypothetical protein PCC6912_39830 [Chlorogloeopsis fritschii PCC 6912]